jgi:hypothetical protein
LTPLDFGLRVRSDINTLLVTARNKMRSASSMECTISLSGVTIETPELYADEQKNNENLNLFKRWNKQLLEHGNELVQQGKIYGYMDVPFRKILDFIEEFNISPKNEQFNVNSIAKFIKDYAGDELKKWDIAFVTGGSSVKFDIDDNCSYNYPRRSYSIENNGRIIKMSGSKRRLGSTGDAKFGLSKELIDSVESRPKRVFHKCEEECTLDCLYDRIKRL